MRIKFLSGALSGAIFIVIIFMLIILAAMGYSGMMATNANLSASAESIEHNQKFYYLDGEGLKFIAHMDTLLLNAQNLTNEYIGSGAYTRLTHPDLPLSMQTFIREGYSDGGGAFLEQVIEMLFLFYADRELEGLREIYPSVVITAPSEYANGFDNVRSLFADITITHPQVYNFHLSITVGVNSYNEFRYEHRAGNTFATRYRITSWRLWESPTQD